MSFWSKRIKDTKTIAKELNVDEKKVKELTNGERQIEGKTMDKVLEVIEKEKINKPIRNLEILQWYRDTDLKALREKFGYATQTELAKELDTDSSTICRFEKKEPIKVVGAKLIQYYNFFQDDFNKKINNDKKIYNWYTSVNNLREYSQKFGYSKNKLMSELNLSYDQIRDFENHTYKSATSVVKKAYNFFHNENNRLPEIKFSENLKHRWDKIKKVEVNASNEEIFKWYSETDFVKLRGDLSQLQLSRKIGIPQSRYWYIENHKIVTTNESLKQVYNYFNNKKENTLKPLNEIREENNLPKVEKEIEVKNIEVKDNEVKIEATYKNKTILDEVTKLLNEKEHEVLDLKTEIEDLKTEIEDLKLQLTRYEKLIDRL